MSEEVLKALMELFALIVKQDGGMLENERSYVLTFLDKQITHDDAGQYIELFDSFAGEVVKTKSTEAAESPSVKDSVKILSICKKISRTLNQEQRVVSLLRLYELVNSDKQFTPQRMNIINTVAEVFRIPYEEFSALEQFIRNVEPVSLHNPYIYIIEGQESECYNCRGIDTGFRETTLVTLHIKSTDQLFIKYLSPHQLYLNGLPIVAGNVYSFPSGSSLRSTQGNPIYYTDIASKFRVLSGSSRILLEVENLTYVFPDGKGAVENVSFSVNGGNLLGIMGASGSGKTTLLNLLSGITTATSGSVRINGVGIDSSPETLEGVIGYVPQSDMLMENLTVFENIYYAARLSFRDKSREETELLVKETLINLDLYELRHLKVGSPLNKVISGGQRKRLNIALELLREPAVLFLDEPTSGLSSRDSENVMDLLRELSIKGKLVVSVIHQPSSDLYKLFNKVVILDQGGHLAYFGNPVESIIHFKTLDAQINSKQGECPACGTVNPDTIFRIIETEVVDEYGKYTGKRRVSPEEWSRLYHEKRPPIEYEEVKEPPATNLEKPGRVSQYLIYLRRDLANKIANRQYMLLTLLEAPVLGFILSFLIRYIDDPNSDVYVFADNENIPTFIFMSVIVALFLGLVVSAEEIFQDRTLLRRERFLNLSRHSYLLSKVTVMAAISVIQVASFILVANSILEIRGMFPNYFAVLFTIAFCANMIGLNISSSLNSAITIYIVIPLLMIPMMVLGGAMFQYDKLNRAVGSVDKVPLIAEIMPTRWAYEALMVTQFRDSKYGKWFYADYRELSIAEFNSVQRIGALERALTDIRDLPFSESTEKLHADLEFLRIETKKLAEAMKIDHFRDYGLLEPQSYNSAVETDYRRYLEMAKATVGKEYNYLNNKQDTYRTFNKASYNGLKAKYHNTKLGDIVTRLYETPKSFIYRNRLIQNYEPIYMYPEPSGLLKFRTHFFSPEKNFMGRLINTLYFNISLLLFFAIVLYFLLYINAGARIVSFFERKSLQK